MDERKCLCVSIGTFFVCPFGVTEKSATFVSLNILFCGGETSPT